MPNAKVEEFTPNIPNDLFRELGEIDAMFAEASGITSVLAGRGETGVRSQGHASQLARLGSSRAKKRALTIEDSLEKMATLYLKMMMVYDHTRYRDEDGNEFIAAQFTEDFVVKVDAHSISTRGGPRVAPARRVDLSQRLADLDRFCGRYQQNIARLDIPMYDAIIVRVLKRAGYASDQSENMGKL